MPFQEALRAQRLALELSENEAADRLHLSLREYQDREAGRVGVNFPERCGLLAGLGLTWAEAVTRINLHPDISNPLSDIGGHLDRFREDPFVLETKREFVLVSRQHINLSLKISKKKLKAPEDILKWVFHASEKAWVTKEHISLFVDLASQSIGLQLYPL